MSSLFPRHFGYRVIIPFRMSSGCLDWNPLSLPSMGLSNDDTGAIPIPSYKRHTACDECSKFTAYEWKLDSGWIAEPFRTGKRKLKCSGETTGCTRCIKQSLVCHYSIQKQMGRPPKKRMREDEDTDLLDIQGNEQWPDLDNDHLSSLDLEDSAGPPGLLPQVYCTPFRVPHAFPQLLSSDSGQNHFWEKHNIGAVDPLPATASPWPDFSSVSAATAFPLTKPSDTESVSLPDSDNHHSAAPQCSCLSYLYLCLSHLSSLAPFPVSQHTLCSLFIGAKTARDVIRCEECPKTYATGVQNVMLTGTLLNVVADTWLRVSKADPVELGRQTAPPAYVSSLTKSSNPAEGWKQWLRLTVRSAVIGTPFDIGRIRCSDSPDLLSLIREFEGRQRRWHSRQHPLSWLRPDDSSTSPESQDNSSSDSGMNECDEKDYLCLRVIGSVKEVMSKFNFEPHEYPDGAAFSASDDTFITS